MTWFLYECVVKDHQSEIHVQTAEQRQPSISSPASRQIVENHGMFWHLNTEISYENFMTKCFVFFK